MKEKIAISPEFAHLSDFIASLPGTFDNMGSLIHSGRNTLRLIKVGDRDFVVKRFGKKNFLSQIGYLFKPGKARRSFTNASRLQSLGISSPTPVAFSEYRSAAGLITDSYYVSVYEQSEPIEAALGTNEQPQFDFIRSFARFAAKLHERGVRHNDLNNSNVRFVINPGTDEIQFSVIDLNRMRIYPHALRGRKAYADLTRFSTFGTVFAILAEEYARARGLDKYGLHEIFAAKLSAENFNRIKNRLKRRP